MFKTTSTIIDGADLTAPVHRLRGSEDGRRQLAATGRNPQDAYSRRNRGERMTKWKARRFVAWDGEGVTVKGRHRYVILANSYGESLVNPQSIGTQEALEFFLTTAQRDKLAIHVIFAGSYDVNMILSPVLQRHQARILADTGKVTLWLDNTRYRITYHPRHTFEVREEVWNPITERLVKVRAFTLWDVFGSFQSTFVVACKRTLPPADLEDLKQISDMKDKRGTFRLRDIPEMTAYCHAELKALVKLCELDADNFARAGFNQTRWDGAGAKASAVLRVNQVGRHKLETADMLAVPVKAAYAGGRIEQYRFGQHDGPLFTVDIRSAYPWAATKLPSLKGGRWTRFGPSEPQSMDEFSIWHVRYRGSRCDGLHPFFWRGPDGRICYPQTTEGWYWGPEVAVALANMTYRDRITILDAWHFEPAADKLPFEFVPKLYHARRVLESQMKGRGWPLKLALNSLYGKLAQQIGGKDGKAPRWHQLEWAGYITSRCRAEMFRIAAPRRDALVSVETDGLTFLGEPDADLLRLVSDNLGGLEVERYDAGTFVQSGIYWLHRDGAWHDPKVRGVGHGVLNRADFVNAWSGDWSPVTVDVTRFRGLITSCLTEDRWSDWCQWMTEPRDIAVCPDGKRVHVGEDCRTCVGDSAGLHETLPTGGGSRSHLHTLSWESSLGRTTHDAWWLDTLEVEDSDELERF